MNDESPSHPLPKSQLDSISACVHRRAPSAAQIASASLKVLKTGASSPSGVILVCEVDDVAVCPGSLGIGACNSSVVRVATSTVGTLNIWRLHAAQPRQTTFAVQRHNHAIDMNLHAWLGLSPSWASIKVSEQQRTSNVSVAGLQRDKNIAFPGFSSVWQP